MAKNWRYIRVLCAVFFIATEDSSHAGRAELSPEIVERITSGAWRIYALPDWNLELTVVLNPDKTVIVRKRGANAPKLRWGPDGNGIELIDAVTGKQVYHLVAPFDPKKTGIMLPLDAKDRRGLCAVKAGYEQPQDPASSTAPAAPSPAPATAPPTASAAPLVDPAIQKSAADIVSDYHNSLVFVTGKAGAGSGFIANIGNSNFLVTNAHVAAGLQDAGFTTMGGVAVQAGAASVAVGCDIVCMQMPAGGKPFEIMQKVDGSVALGDAVVVLGNADGAGVINTIVGKIVGIGPNLVEVDAPFIPGNSGSPIVHIKSGKVIGVATYTITRRYDDATGRKLATPAIRRFGYRLDTVKAWQAVDWRTFYAQAAQMESIEDNTGEFEELLRDFDDNGTVTQSDYKNPLIKNRISQWLDLRLHGKRDTKALNEDFYASICSACQTDMIAVRGRIGYDYFQRDLADQQQIRDKISKAFQAVFKELSGP